jgi:hypothetical protein
VTDLVGELADLRRQPLAKQLAKEFLQGKLFRFSAYDADIPAFLSALDSDIRFADASARYKRVVPKFRKKLYVQMATASELPAAREKLESAVKAWLAEVDAFQPAVKTAMKKLLAPFTNTLKLPVDPSAVVDLIG